MPLLAMDPLARARAETRANQGAAADPGISAWVSANAGTGKTHVLTMRVLRLLLAGTEPERILALTYTKAAAAEMATRVFGRLAEWVTANDAELGGKLADLLDRRPSAAEMRRARQLFAVAIETPGGLKVQTIHAFCERLLQRFPLEAGVPPGFEILDDHERAALLQEAADATLAEAAAAAPEAPLARALAAAVGFAAEASFDALLGDALREQAWLDAAVRLDLDGDERLAEAERIYRLALDLPPDASLEATERALAHLLPDAELACLRDVLAGGQRSDAKACERVAAAMAANGTADRIRELWGLFLTSGGEPRKALMTKGLVTGHRDVARRLQEAQERFVALYDVRCRLQLLDATLALVRLGSCVMQRYAEAKARQAKLDFDDLIGRAASLLRSSDAVEWVLYKLDGGLDHILVDEAQDTSPLQWQVVRALAEELFSGRGAREEPRTLFAVGDEKQSIYSFQGAAPRMFAAMGEDLGQRAQRAGLAWRRLPLTLSFRTVEPLLAAVDAVFADPQRTPGVGAVQAPLRHVAARAGHAGLVEIWPTEKHEPAEPAEPWSPLAESGASPSVARLTSRIATTITGWLEGREMLASEKRPVRPGDILVLVRKRLPFAPALVSALKARGVPVAGADRLVLTEQIAVQDLMALGDVLTLPDDDLALAAVLKSPLLGIEDDDLMTIAHGRAGSLWQALMAQRGTGAPARMSEAAERLQRWQRWAESLPPFELYSAVLDREGGRARMLARLGSEAADAIDELLNLALAHDAGAPPSLQGFLCWLRQGQREIKRDMEPGRNEVRVMTVHGAKGLEAPIVFLPDTCSTKSARQPNALLTLEDAARPSGVAAPFLWPVKGSGKVAVVKEARQRVALAETEERNRLLYVALTRARDRLYVAGFEGVRPPPPDCWYHLIKDGLAGRLAEETTADGRTVWRLRSDQTAPPVAGKAPTPAAAGAARLPAWATTPAPREPVLRMPLVPSRLAPLERDEAHAERARAARRSHAEPAMLPPAALAEDARFLRGTLTHALLEHLPGVPQRRWADAARVFLAARAAQLPERVRLDIAEETLAVLQDPALAPLFGPESRAEVAIAADIPYPGGAGPALRLTGKIDRLVQRGGEVLILDYKTNRPPPAEPEAVADAYLFQLAAYRLGVSHIFPGSRVEAALLWTDGPRFMPLPGGLLDGYEAQLWQQAPASPSARPPSSLDA
jgi:ATP-dependent helicase/nuclease subunit A